MSLNPKTKNILIGVGIGVAIGGTAGYIVGKTTGTRKIRKRHDDDIREARKSAYRNGYSRGTEDTMAETQKWMDENLIVVDADNPEAAQEAIRTHIQASEPVSPLCDESEHDVTVEAVKTALEAQIRPSPKGPEDPEIEEIFSKPAEENKNNTENPGQAINDAKPIFENGATLTGDNVVSVRYNSEVFEYPKSLFYDEDGYYLGQTQVRSNLLEYERNPVTLKKLWLALGWGDYFPDPTSIALSDEDLNNMDLAVDEQLGDEPEIKTIERQRYLDKVEAYKNDPTSSPKIVSRRKFEEDCYLNHIYVDYYADDNVFVDSTDIESELDAFTMFGVTDGKELFKYKKEHPFPEDEDDNDPEVVHVENFMDNSIAEITMYHKSYASLKDGSAFVDGDST